MCGGSATEIGANKVRVGFATEIGARGVEVICQEEFVLTAGKLDPSHSYIGGIWSRFVHEAGLHGVGTWAKLFKFLWDVFFGYFTPDNNNWLVLCELATRSKVSHLPLTGILFFFKKR